MKTLHIFGMGSAGQSIVQHLQRFFPTVETLFCYDDDTKKIDSNICSVRIRGPIETAIENYTFTTTDTVLFAMPSAPKSRIAALYYLLRKKHCAAIQIIPSSTPIIEGPVYLPHIRPIKPEDVIGRTYKPLSLYHHKENTLGKNILITGAGGSLGQELALQCLWLSFSTLYLLGHGETSIVRVYRHLKSLQSDGLSPATKILPIILDLQDRAAVQKTIASLKIDFVINTAAHKHVLLMEDNPYAAFANNVAALINLYDALQEQTVETILQVSTDKAVDPQSVYGTTKMIAETLSVHAPLPGRVVRFGNILSSRGSIAEVIERHSIAQVLELTHPDSKRYYMSVSEAASLILRLLFDGRHHSIYGLDMGDPVKLREIVAALLQFYFPHVHKSIQVSYKDLALAEKFSEKLLGFDETTAETDIPRVFSIHKEGRSDVPNNAYYKKLRVVLLDLLHPDLDISHLRSRFDELHKEFFLHCGNNTTDDIKKTSMLEQNAKL